MKKLLSIAILLCGLMLGKLGAEQAYGVKLVVVTGIEDERPLIGKYTFDIVEITMGYQPKYSGNVTYDTHDFVCSGEIVELFSRILNSERLEISKSDPDYEQIQRKINKYMRSLRNIGVSYSDYHISYQPPFQWREYVYYDFMAEFNLFEKMKLSFPKGKRRDAIITNVMLGLAEVQEGRSFNKINASDGYKAGVDDNTLEDLSYEFRDFTRTKIEELSTMKINHTKRLLENTCAPLEKASENTGGTDIFDKTKIKHLEDLDPTQVTKFIPEQQRKFIIIQENE